VERKSVKVSYFETARYSVPQPPPAEWPVPPGLMEKLELFGTKVLPRVGEV
jgi:hypothetical protein